MKLKDGDVVIELFDTIAPNHVKRFKKLSDEKKYNGVAFHRVIEGFMAQSGDVKYGNIDSGSYNPSLVGTGGSDYPDLKAEFSELHMREVHCQWLAQIILIVLTVNFLYVLNLRHS